MIKFCNNCGSPVEANARFCSNCGSIAGSTGVDAGVGPVVPAAGPSPVSVPGPSISSAATAQQPASTKTSPVIKIIFILLAIFVFIIVAAMGSCAYVAYRMKKKAEQIEQSYKKSGLEQLARAVDNGANAKRRNGNSVCPPFNAGTDAQASADSGTAHIPLRKGLTLIKAYSRPEGDEETITRIGSIDRDVVHVSASGTSGVPVFGNRAVCQNDLQTARIYITGFGSDFAEVLPGSTMFSMSADMFHDLKSKGATLLTYVEYEKTLGVPLESRSSGIMSRVEPKPVKFPVIVNDQRMELPAIHARGKLEEQEAEAFVLDDSRNPLMLRFAMGGNAIQVIKISYIEDAKPALPIQTNESASSGTPPQGLKGAPRIQQALQETGRAEVYGIYFDFAKADIRPESEPVMKEIANVLRNNPSWRLSVEGHTDNIGGDTYNLDLSKRRASAVKQALVEQYGIDESRLTTAGFGATRPKESNETLEGRARNRRVELVRQ